MATSAAHQALVIPEGAHFEANTQGWIVSNMGDIRLLGAPALPLFRVSSEEGDIELAATTAVTLDRLSAPRGVVRVSGPVTVHSILARRVVFASGALSVRSMVAEERIELLGEQLQADMVVAPEVVLDKDTKGRATVIQSKNEIGATQLKGGFRMDDFVELFPNGQELINQYADVKDRMARWAGGQAPSPAPAAPRAPAPTPAPAPVAPRAPAPAATVVEEDSPEVLGQPIAGSDDAVIIGEDDNDVAVLSAEPDDEKLFQKLSDRIRRISASYGSAPIHPQIHQMDRLIKSRQFVALRDQINGIYNELLRNLKRDKLPAANVVAAAVRDIQKVLTEEL